MRHPTAFHLGGLCAAALCFGSLPALQGCGSLAPAADATATLDRADAAMGTARLQTLRFAGRGTGGTFGQAWQPGIAWPMLNVSQLTRWVDYGGDGAFREDVARSRAEARGGGAIPLLGGGEQRASGSAAGGFAWSGQGAQAVASPVALDARVHDLWTTPHGVLKAARRWGATAGRRSDGGVDYDTLAVSVPGRLQATAWIDAMGRVARIDSVMPHPVLGDTPVVTRFDGYEVADGIAFPRRIRQSQGAFEVLDLAVTEVQPQAPVAIEAPPAVRNFSERVAVQPVAPGVWFLAGGSHNSVAVELSDRILLVESPLYDGRALAVIQAANRLVPGKAVRQVVNSHHHFDHAGGLRTAVAEGAELITSAAAKPYFERVLANPNRVAPDRLAASGRSARIVGVADRLVIDDALRRVEVHALQGSIHAEGFLAVHLPAERLLVEADAWTPGPPDAPPPPVPPANAVNLADNIQRLGLVVDRILPLHGRVATVADLQRHIGR